MAKVGAQRAATLTGKSKSTIQRAMNSGKLSFEIDANNRRIIDVSELDRVFGLMPQNQENEPSSTQSVEAELKKASDMIEMERLKLEIKSLETQLETAREQIEDLKEQRDQWQKQAQQVLLTSQYSQKQAEELKAELKEREEKARQRKQQALEERMKKLKGNNENAQEQPRRMTSDNAAAGEQGSSFDFQGLWSKIKGRATA